MVTLVQPGNAMPLGGPGGGNSSSSMEDEIVNKTKEQAFPTGPQISLENFEHYGPAAANTQQTLGDMINLSGKELSESYRVGLPKSAALTQKVADR